MSKKLSLRLSQWRKTSLKLTKTLFSTLALIAYGSSEMCLNEAYAQSNSVRQRPAISEIADYSNSAMNSIMIAGRKQGYNGVNRFDTTMIGEQGILLVNVRHDPTKSARIYRIPLSMISSDVFVEYNQPPNGSIVGLRCLNDTKCVEDRADGIVSVSGGRTPFAIVFPAASKRDVETYAEIIRSLISLYKPIQ